MKRQLLSGKITFNTLMIGSQDNAIAVYKKTEKNLHDGGYRYTGFVTPDHNGKNGIQKLIPNLDRWINWKVSLRKIISSR
ncbi:MAG: hypothetical protein WDO71_03485 [Bacteroidota bacterium]